MELSKLLKPLSIKDQKSTKKDLLDTVNKALKSSMNLKDMSYAQIDPGSYALNIVISDTKLIFHMKKDIEALGFAQTSNENDYQNFIENAFKKNKLCITCKNPILDKNWIIDTSSIRFDVARDPRLFNVHSETGIPFKMQFNVIPRTTKAKRHLSSAKQTSGYGQFTGKIPHTPAHSAFQHNVSAKHTPYKG